LSRRPSAAFTYSKSNRDPKDHAGPEEQHSVLIQLCVRMSAGVPRVRLRCRSLTFVRTHFSKLGHYQQQHAAHPSGASKSWSTAIIPGSIPNTWTSSASARCRNPGLPQSGERLGPKSASRVTHEPEAKCRHQR